MLVGSPSDAGPNAFGALQEGGDSSSNDNAEETADVESVVSMTGLPAAQATELLAMAAGNVALALSLFFEEGPPPAAASAPAPAPSPGSHDSGGKARHGSARSRRQERQKARRQATRGHEAEEPKAGALLASALSAVKMRLEPRGYLAMPIWACALSASRPYGRS